MRILVFEFASGGGFARTELDPELVAEGQLMLRAVVADLGELPDIDLAVTCDHRLPILDLPCQTMYLKSDQSWADSLEEILPEFDAVWPIAPETDHVLERVTTAVVDAGCLLLNSRPEAVRITASKKETIRRLQRFGVPVVPTVEPSPALFGEFDPIVLKPDDGVGCIGSRICHGPADLAQALADQGEQRLIAQPYVEGLSMSLSLLCRDGKAKLLACNRLRVAVINDSFRLLGCVANDRPGQEVITKHIIDSIALAIPGLWGYVGVDLILGREGPRILEINPRLTLSYVGLKRGLGINPAALVLALLDRETPLKSLQPDAIGARTSVNIELESILHSHVR